MIGEKVWLESYNLSTDAPSKKLAAKRLSPYTITGKVGDTAYQLDIPITWRTHNVFHTSLLSRTKRDMIPGWSNAPQPVVQIQDQELCAMDSVIPIISDRGYMNGSRKGMERGS